MSYMTPSEFVVMDHYYSPPGITHPFFQENYAWVDQLLEEKYYNYALTAQNADEYQAANLLTDNYAWVDYRLEEMCAINGEDLPLMLAPLSLANYREDAELEQLDIQLSGNKRKRSESDMFDYETDNDTNADDDISDISDVSDNSSVVSDLNLSDICEGALLFTNFSEAIDFNVFGQKQSSKIAEDYEESIPYDVDDISF
jgi:hypothetical protein